MLEYLSRARNKFNPVEMFSHLEIVFLVIPYLKLIIQLFYENVLPYYLLRQNKFRMYKRKLWIKFKQNQSFLFVPRIEKNGKWVVQLVLRNNDFWDDFSCNAYFI